MQQEVLLAAAEALVVRCWFEASRATRPQRPRFSESEKVLLPFPPLGDNVRKNVACKAM